MTSLISNISILSSYIRKVQFIIRKLNCLQPKTVNKQRVNNEYSKHVYAVSDIKFPKKPEDLLQVEKIGKKIYRVASQGVS